MQKLVSAITSYFMHRFTNNLNLGWVSTWMTWLDLHFTYCSKSQWMEIMPVPTCCKLHAHNYTYIPIILGWRGTLDPTGQLVNMVWVVVLGVELWDNYYACKITIISILEAYPSIAAAVHIHCRSVYSFIYISQQTNTSMYWCIQLMQ